MTAPFSVKIFAAEMFTANVATLEPFGKRRKEFGEAEGRAGGRERVQIRQQLQVLREAGLLQHLDSGTWRLP